MNDQILIDRLRERGDTLSVVAADVLASWLHNPPPPVVDLRAVKIGWDLVDSTLFIDLLNHAPLNEPWDPPTRSRLVEITQEQLVEADSPLGIVSPYVRKALLGLEEVNSLVQMQNDEIRELTLENRRLRDIVGGAREILGCTGEAK